MKQQSLAFPVTHYAKTKYLVYADVTLSRAYHDIDDNMSLGFGVPTKKEYKTEQRLVAVVDNEYDVEHMGNIVKEKVSYSRYDWHVESIRYYAQSVDHIIFK